MVDHDRPSTWSRYKAGACDGCRAYCCRLPVEVRIDDLIRMGVATEDDRIGSPRKLERRLLQEGVIRSFRLRSGLFVLAQAPTGDCVYLGKDRRCTIYERRPETCRNFPQIGPRSAFCPRVPL